MFVSAAELIIRAGKIWIMKDAFYALLAVGVAMMAAGAALSASVRYTGAFAGTGTDAAVASDTGSGLMLLGASVASVGVVGESIPYKKKPQAPQLIILGEMAHPKYSEDYPDDQRLQYLARLTEEKELKIVEAYKPKRVFVELTEHQLDTKKGLRQTTADFMYRLEEVCKRIGADIVPMETEHVLRPYSEVDRKRQLESKTPYMEAVYESQKSLRLKAEMALDDLGTLNRRMKRGEQYGDLSERARRSLQELLDAVRKPYAGKGFNFSAVGEINDSNLKNYVKMASYEMVKADKTMKTVGMQLGTLLKYRTLEEKTGLLDESEATLRESRDGEFGNAVVKNLAKDGLNIMLPGGRHELDDSRMIKELKERGVSYSRFLIGEEFSHALASAKKRYGY
jgi:hypothetical protein